MAVKKGIFDTIDIAKTTAGLFSGGALGFKCTVAGAATYKLIKEVASGDDTEYEIVLAVGQDCDFPCSWNFTLTEAGGGTIAANMVYVKRMKMYG